MMRSEEEVRKRFEEMEKIQNKVFDMHLDINNSDFIGYKKALAWVLEIFKK